MVCDTSKGVSMPRMTEEEAFALDGKWTKTDPKLGSNGSGFLAQRKTAHMITIDSLSADYLFSKAIADHKTPAEIISEMVQERLVATQ